MLAQAKALAGLFGPRLDPDSVGDPDFDLVKMAEPVMNMLRRYFRAEVHGIENIPRGTALLVGNHNAGITFLEPFFLGMEWFRYTGGQDYLYFLGHDAMVALPLVGNMLLKLGVIRASHETANRALAAGKKVVVFPGGNFEAFRPFRDRYQIDFGGKTGFVKLALRHGVPIVPVLSIGGHETFFVLHRGERLAELTGVKRYLRSESFPIFIGLPWGIGMGPIFHLPLPAKLTVEVGAPIDLSRYHPKDADNKEILAEIAHSVEDTLQQMMDRRAAERSLPVLG